jgi:hypothetical protein
MINELWQLADSGTDRAVAAVYLAIFGRNITGCRPCIKTDARIELKIYAKNNPDYQVQTFTEMALSKYQLKQKYQDNKTNQIGPYPVSSLTDEKVEKLLATEPEKWNKFFEVKQELIAPEIPLAPKGKKADTATETTAKTAIETPGV